MARPSLREQIVEAGTEVFHCVGFYGCSVEDITKAARVPKGSFYNHFKSKEDLLVEALDRYAQAGPHALLADQTVAPMKRLRKYFDALAADFIAFDHTRGCMIGNAAAELADHNEAIRAKTRSLFTGWADQVAEVIRDGQAAGEIAATQDARLLAGFLLSAWEGTLLRVRGTGDARLLKEFQRIAFGVLLA